MAEYLQFIFRGKLEKCEPIRRIVKIPIRFIEYFRLSLLKLRYHLINSFWNVRAWHNRT